MEKTAKDKINEGREKLDLLKLNSKNIDIRNILVLASNIRDCICNDKDVVDLCNVEEEYALLRKTLLDDIKTFQMDLIKENIKKKEDVSFSKSRVIDFDKAKAALSKMIDNELDLNLFAETGEPHVFDNITDCKSHLDTLHRVSDSCKYGKYKVLIMGDFQSGKSTTLDAFCDGRHICAIGNGIATSAVLVSVTYAEKESMIIHWREDKQFQTIFEKIRQYLPEFDWDTFNLNDKSSREQLANAIEKLRLSKYCPKVGEANAKFLMLCDFVLKYYGTQELQQKKSSLQCITDISEITKFPDNGEETWKKSRLKGFTINDVIFIFIDSVECFIPSVTLKELNCTIIDSPGLFNSSYDTMVTETAMIDAHAIMYVLPYYKGIGRDVCKSLYTIKDKYADLHRKLFIVNNLRLTDGNTIYDSNCKKIKSMFDSIGTITIHRYDARLSYLAQLKKLYALELHKKNDYYHLMHVIEEDFSGSKSEKIFNDFNDAWSYHIGNESHKSIEDILKRSGFNNLISALKHFIAENESYAVVVSNGLIPMRKELVSIKNSLYRSYYEPYNTSYSDLVKLWKTRIRKAKEFQTYVTETVENELYGIHDGNTLLDRMADEEYFKNFDSDFYNYLSERISMILYDNKGKLVVTKKLFKKNKDEFNKRFSEIAAPLIQNELVEVVNRKMLYLYEILDSEQDITVINMFTPVMDKMEIFLETAWNLKFKDDIDFCMEDYLTVPKTLKASQIIDSRDDSNKYNNLSSEGVDSTLIGGLVGQTTAIVVGLAAMISGYLSAVMWDPTGVGQTGTAIASLLLGLAGVFITAFAPEKIRKWCVDFISNRIKAKIQEGAASVFRSLVKDQLKKATDKYVESLKVDIRKMENERDLALRPKVNQENLCFRAVEAIEQIDKQVKMYDEYKLIFVKDETI